ATGRELGSFTSVISPSFVLSRHLPTSNAKSIWLRFGAFLSPRSPSLRIHWPLTTGHCSRATGHYSLATRRTSQLPPFGFTGHWPLATVRWFVEHYFGE